MGALVLAMGCGDSSPGNIVDAAAVPDAPTSDTSRIHAELVTRRAVDVLVVVDSGEGMDARQSGLAATVQEFLGRISAGAGFRPDYQIGVISSDLGAGDDTAAYGCDAEGDRGQLLVGNCMAPTSEPYFVDRDDGQGGRLTNYSGQFRTAFSCVAQLGSSGCTYRQPLEAMRRALSGDLAANDGFLREDALLAVYFLSNSDDCSTRDSALFTPGPDTLDAPLGFHSPFRCFEYGVQCDPDQPRSFGPRQDCHPRANSEYLYDIEEYVAFLDELKGSPASVFAMGTVGTPVPVSVGISDGRPVLDPSCAVTGFGAQPAVRLYSFLEHYQSSTGTVCNTDFSTVAFLGNRVGEHLAAGACVAPQVEDINPDQPGFQTSCEVVEKLLDGQSGQTVSECSSLEDPASSSELPCFILVRDPSSGCNSGQMLHVEVGSGNGAHGRRFQLRCSSTAP